MPLPIDLDKDIAVGISLPIEAGPRGYFAQTYTTMEQVVSNVVNLLLTIPGERYMQPEFGSKLHEHLFEQFDEDLVSEIQATVADSLKYWLPFIIVNNVIVKMSDNLSGDFKNTMEISIHFSLAKDPTTHESVQISVTG